LSSIFFTLTIQAVDNSSDLETLKSLIRSQNDELVQLKAMISEQKKEKVDQIKVIPSVEVEKVTLRNNRWNDIIASADEKPDDIIMEKRSKVVVEVIEPIKAVVVHTAVIDSQPVTLSVKNVVEKPQPLDKVAPLEPQDDKINDFIKEPSAVVMRLTSEVIEEPPPALVIEELNQRVDIIPSPLTIEDTDKESPLFIKEFEDINIHVVFPAKYNRISQHAGDKDFQVRVKADASVDDMFFQLRQEAAKQVAI